MDQDHKAGRAFDESADRRTVSGTHDAVTLPMPDLHPFFDLGGPLCDHRHAGEPAPPLQALDPTSTPPTPRFRRASQIDPWIVNRLIDRLGTQVAGVGQESAAVVRSGLHRLPSSSATTS